MSKTKYSKVSIESAENGWIVTENGEVTKVFVRWESVVQYITGRLTTK